MTSLLFILLGVVLTLCTIIGWATYLTASAPSRAEAHLARLEQLRAERRLHRITQAAVAQMFDIARGRR